MEQFTINGDFPSIFVCLPEGKRSHNYRRSPFLVGKSTISMAIFNSYVTNYQKVWYVCVYIYFFFSGFPEMVVPQ